MLTLVFTRALDLCRFAAGIPEENLLKWDLKETGAKSGPYPEIRESDVFVVSNCWGPSFCLCTVLLLLKNLDAVRNAIAVG